MKTFPLLLLSWAICAWGQPHVSPLLSALASSLGFSLMWVAVLSIQARKRRYLVSSLWFCAVQLVQLSWLASPTYQGTYIFFVYGALALALGAEFGVLSLLLPSKGPLPFKRVCAIASLWTLMEWSRLFFLCGFAWNPVGLSLTGYPLSGQLASVTGVFGLSFLVMVTNLLAVNLLYKKDRKPFLSYGSFLLFPYLFGMCHIASHQNKEARDSFNVALVQTALLPDEKNYYYGKESRFVHPYEQWAAIFTHVKRLYTENLDLIVLPEAALPFSSHARVYPYQEMIPFIEKELGDLSSLFHSPLAEEREGKWYVSNAFWAQALANHYRAEVVIGLDTLHQGKSYNAAFHFIPDRSDCAARYDKRVLLPLAEYLPFSFLKPLVARYGITDFFSRGESCKVVGQKYPMSLSVCYEECFPHIMREGKLKGAKLFVNVTNDGWYPFSQLPQQHFMHGRVRAIENGTSLLRACNTGVTAAVDSFGRTIDLLEGSEKGALFVSFTPDTFFTLYTFWGDAFILLISFSVLAFSGKKQGFFRNPLAVNREPDLS